MIGTHDIQINVGSVSVLITCVTGQNGSYPDILRIRIIPVHIPLYLDKFHEFKSIVQ